MLPSSHSFPCAIIGSLGGEYQESPAAPGLWQTYDQSLKAAKYIDLTHTIAPGIPVWKGFGASRFSPSVDPQTRRAYTYSMG